MAKQNDRLETYFQHYAEVLAQGQVASSPCTIVEIEGKDCLYELGDGSGTWHGWWRDGESVKDIVWKDA